MYLVTGVKMQVTNESPFASHPLLLPNRQKKKKRKRKRKKKKKKKRTILNAQ